MKTKITDFTFRFSGHGHFKVLFTSPVTGKEWERTISDMPLIDCTKNAEIPKLKDLEQLKRVIKNH